MSKEKEETKDKEKKIKDKKPMNPKLKKGLIIGGSLGLTGAAISGLLYGNAQKERYEEKLDFHVGGEVIALYGVEPPNEDIKIKKDISPIQDDFDLQLEMYGVMPSK